MRTASLRAGGPAACLAASLAAIALAFFQVCDQDVFWHLAVGRVTLETGHRVTTNVFSSLFPDHPWFNPEGGYDVLLALAHRAGGWAGVAVFKAILAGALGAALCLLLLRARREPLSAAALSVVALAAMRSRLTERPQVVSVLFLVLTMLAVELHRERGGRALWFLPPLFALWSNLHAELMLGLLYLAGAAVGEACNRRGGKARDLLLAALLGAVASLANPGGWLVLRHPFLHFGLDQVVAVNEFVFASPSLVPIVWALAGCAVGALAAARRRLDWAEVLTLAGLLLVGARYVREIPYAAAAAALCLHRHLPEALPRPRLRATLLAAAVALSATWALRYDRLLPYRWGWGVDDRAFPVAAAGFLERHDLPGRLYNHYNQGGYLLYRLYPRRGVFQDSRTSAYPQDFLARLHGKHGAGWREILDEYGVGTALVRTPEVDLFFPVQEWGVVYWDDDFTVLVRRTPGNGELLARLEYRLFRPDYARLIWSADARTLRSLAEEMVRARADRSRPSAVLARDLGVVLGRTGSSAAAEGALREAVGLDGGDANAWYYLGLAEEELGRPGDARAAYERALRLDRGHDKARQGLQRLGSSPGPARAPGA